MIARAASKAQGSRDAAHHLHSPAALQEQYSIEGVSAEDIVKLNLNEKLKANGITAELSDELDSKMKQFLQMHVEDIGGSNWR